MSRLTLDEIIQAGRYAQIVKNWQGAVISALDRDDLLKSIGVPPELIKFDHAVEVLAKQVAFTSLGCPDLKTFDYCWQGNEELRERSKATATGLLKEL